MMKLDRMPRPKQEAVWKANSDFSPYQQPGSFALAAGDGFFGRAWRIVRSQINSILKYFEDPAKIMEQSILDMNADLIRVKQSFAEIAANHQRLLNQRELTQKKIIDLATKAALAVKNSNDDLARLALTQKQEQARYLESLEKQIDLQNSLMTRLQESIRTLEGKIVEIKREKDSMTARAKVAESTLKVNEMLQSLSSSATGVSNSMSAYSTMKERVLDLEAKAEVSNQYTDLTLTTLDNQFEDQERQASVEEELLALKTRGRSAPSVVEVHKKSNLK